MKVLLLFTLSFLSTTCLLAQEKQAFSFGIEGMAGVSFGNQFIAFNVGGPALQLRLAPHLKVGVCALPSFYIRDGKTGARLGVSPRIDFKKVVLIAPCFFFERTDKWVYSIGLAYKFKAH